MIQSNQSQYEGGEKEETANKECSQPQSKGEEITDEHPSKEAHAHAHSQPQNYIPEVDEEEDVRAQMQLKSGSKSQQQQMSQRNKSLTAQNDDQNLKNLNQEVRSLPSLYVFLLLILLIFGGK